MKNNPFRRKKGGTAGEPGPDNKKEKTKRTFAAQIISVICALVLWFYVSGVESPTYEKTFPALALELVGGDLLLSQYQYTVISGYQFSVDVTLTGKRSDLNKISAEDIEVFADLLSINGAGKNELSVQISPPNGMTVQSYEPRFVTIYVGKPTAKELPITVNATYSVPSNYLLGEYRFVADNGNEITSVKLSGPENELDKVDRAQIDVNFGALNSSVEARGKIVLLDKNGNAVTNQYIKSNISEVIVTLPVYTYKTVELAVKQTYGTFTDNQLSFVITPATISVKGEPELLRDLDEILVSTINEREIDGTRSYQFTIPLPAGVENADTTNIARVAATLKNVVSHTVSLQDADHITFTPPGNGLLYKTPLKPVNIKLIGVDNTVLNATELDLIVKVDLSQYTQAGNYRVPMLLSVRDGLTYHTVGNYTLDVELYK